jgi:predicted  nucleic acid-binding Zn-ribbon protein
MSEATDIEKKSLEAHVELCAERYNQLEQRFEHVDSKISSLEALMREVHDMVAKINEKRNDQLISWGLGIIGGLVALSAYLIVNYVIIK